MSSNTPAATQTDSKTQDTRVFVEIPRAKPGQGYVAPKNFEHPLLQSLSRLAIVALCASLPLAPALIIGFILFLPQSHAVQQGFLWLWIPMAIFVEAFAIFIAIGVAREALGSSGSDQYTR
jgi:hypothetical protein